MVYRRKDSDGRGEVLSNGHSEAGEKLEEEEF